MPRTTLLFYGYDIVPWTSPSLVCVNLVHQLLLFWPIETFNLCNNNLCHLAHHLRGFFYDIFSWSLCFFVCSIHTFGCNFLRRFTSESQTSSGRFKVLSPLIVCIVYVDCICWPKRLSQNICYSADSKIVRLFGRHNSGTWKLLAWALLLLHY